MYRFPDNLTGCSQQFIGQKSKAVGHRLIHSHIYLRTFFISHNTVMHWYTEGINRLGKIHVKKKNNKKFDIVDNP